ncbi:saccharopine dehydrogenase NADP-binding domain-containing protein [Glacieibacterium megasporae]|uniref:saccharopine dehydrogenase NADP-binding domain-containing protein n=1 Tax=Glacieibacterium megasporae TaxID=2835787 RepID=UPI001C1E5777|nr:saccharopine dehydrogenase NADP-binding domain-containing protein [Polymorphobacter megasporae]UAJ10619.1 saccharopine dehydrogenase NADP-binding domain-containing protein [Polymorphobacter megasporae]
MNEVWIMGASGRIGSAVAKELASREIPLVLMGRDRNRLERVAANLAGGRVRSVIVGSMSDVLARLKAGHPAVVVNTIGPFARTALPVIQASGKAHYLDLSNELTGTIDTLAQHDSAVSQGRTYVTGAGWGVLGTESVVLKLCEGEPPALTVRVDNMAQTDDVGPLGEAIGGTIVDALRFGGMRYRNGRLVGAQAGGEPLALIAPDGYRFTTGSMPVGEMEAARRASGAPNVVSAAGAAPTAPILRFFVFPILAAVMKIDFMRRAAAKQFAKMPSPKRANEASWAHARVQWSDGRSKEGWLKAGEGMDFTARLAAEVAARLYEGKVRPGSYTPGALFGPELVNHAGGVFDLGAVR